MIDRLAREDVAGRLRSLGYEVDDIPASRDEEKIADLWAHADDDCLVVEIKTRFEDEGVVKELASSPKGTVVSRQVPLVRRNVLSGIVATAASQIATSQRNNSGLGLLWFRPEVDLGFADAPDQMEATLLGRRHAFCRNNGELICLVCYLATHTDFHRFPGIDAAVIDHADGGSKLLVNPYSERQNELRTSRLYRFLAGEGGVVDLREDPALGGTVVLFGDFERGDDAEVLRVLEEQRPGWKCQFVEMQGLAGYIRPSDAPAK